MAGELVATGGADLLVMLRCRIGGYRIHFRTTLRDGGAGCTGIENARTLGQHARQISMVGGLPLHALWSTPEGHH